MSKNESDVQKTSGKKKNKKKKQERESNESEIKELNQTNPQVLELRLTAAEKTYTAYRDYARNLAAENIELRSRFEKTEKDTLDVVGYLKDVDEEKDKKIENLIKKLQSIKSDHELQMEKQRCHYENRLLELGKELQSKMEEIVLLRSELKLVKDFRLQRTRMQCELEEIKEGMREMEKEHKETLEKLEKKFVEDKAKIQKISDAKLAQLAARAQTEAIANLSKTAKSVYKENVRLGRALALHTSETERLRLECLRFEQKNIELKEKSDTNEQIIEQKIAESSKQKKIIKELEEKIASLDSASGSSLKIPDTNQMALVTSEKSVVTQQKCESLERALALKIRELSRLRKASRSVLTERSLVERFLLEALEHVRKEIAASRIQYRKDAETAYRQKMFEACGGRGEYPPVRTFSRGESSTNSVYRDLESAQQQYSDDFTEAVDISEMTWEQREKVLRELFRLISSKNVNKKSTTPTETAEANRNSALQAAYEAAVYKLDHQTSQNEDDLNITVSVDPTFITEAIVDEATGKFERLPKINL